MMHLAQAFDAVPLHLGRGAELVRIDLGKSPITDTLDTQRPMPDQSLPHGQRSGTREAQIAASDELVPTQAVGLFDDRVEGGRVSVDVRDAQKTHAENFVRSGGLEDKGLCWRACACARIARENWTVTLAQELRK